MVHCFIFSILTSFWTRNLFQRRMKRIRKSVELTYIFQKWRVIYKRRNRYNNRTKTNPKSRNSSKVKYLMTNHILKKLSCPKRTLPKKQNNTKAFYSEVETKKSKRFPNSWRAPSRFCLQESKRFSISMIQICLSPEKWMNKLTIQLWLLSNFMKLMRKYTISWSLLKNRDKIMKIQSVWVTYKWNLTNVWLLKMAISFNSSKFSVSLKTNPTTQQSRV